MAEFGSPLWEAACRLWERAAVREACLALQDDWGLNPNELLFALWCAEQHRLLRHEKIAPSEARRWHERVTQPVRRARKNAGRFGFMTETVQESLRDTELRVEEVELKMLFDSLDQLSVSDGRDPGQIVVDNLYGFVDIDSGGAASKRALLEKLIACSEA